MSENMKSLWSRDWRQVQAQIREHQNTLPQIAIEGDYSEVAHDVGVAAKRIDLPPRVKRDAVEMAATWLQAPEVTTYVAVVDRLPIYKLVQGIAIDAQTTPTISARVRDVLTTEARTLAIRINNVVGHSRMLENSEAYDADREHHGPMRNMELDVYNAVPLVEPEMLVDEPEKEMLTAAMNDGADVVLDTLDADAEREEMLLHTLGRLRKSTKLRETTGRRVIARCAAAADRVEDVITSSKTTYGDIMYVHTARHAGIVSGELRQAADEFWIDKRDQVGFEGIL